eukprot:1426483-Pyramimonas_sp.AAC.1
MVVITHAWSPPSNYLVQSSTSDLRRSSAPRSFFFGWPSLERLVEHLGVLGDGGGGALAAVPVQTLLDQGTLLGLLRLGRRLLEGKCEQGKIARGGGWTMPRSLSSGDRAGRARARQLDHPPPRALARSLDCSFSRSPARSMSLDSQPS